MTRRVNLSATQMAINQHWEGEFLTDCEMTKWNWICPYSNTPNYANISLRRGYAVSTRTVTVRLDCDAIVSKAMLKINM